MDRDGYPYDVRRRLYVAAAIAAAAVVLATMPLRAEMPTQVAAAAVASTPAATSGAAASSRPAASAARAACEVRASEARLDYSLPRTARRLAEGKPIKIVALGSSSTAGAGASSPAASYPSQLALELRKRFPGRDITVVNRGANGEEAPDMLARFETSVIAERPDLVIWQLGTNWVLRDRPLDPRAIALHDGLARLKAIHADVILVDPQYTPSVIAKTGTEAMVEQLAATAKEQSVDLFHRFAVMRHWQEVDHLPFDAFVSPDGLHMNDWSYACFAKWLATGIAEAATRPTATAGTQTTHAH
jgi:lysophospholipase L1-like esterase